MAQFIDKHYWWLDGSRYSQNARLENRQGQYAAIEFMADEDTRAKQLPGKHSGSFSVVMLDYDAPTMDILNSYTDRDELAFLSTLNSAAGQKAWLYRCYAMSNAPGAQDGALATRGMDFNVSGSQHQSLGLNLHDYTADVTAPANGTTVTVGALSATQKLLIMSHVEAVSGTGNLDHKLVNDPAGTPADTQVFTTVAHTDISSPANHNSGQYYVVDGPTTPTDYRIEITAVSGGTWNFQAAAAIVE